MTISPELFLAILSMDSYNRGYGAGLGDEVNGLGVDGIIGGASIKTHQELNISDAQYDAWQAAGFYAVAYEVDGEIVNSYRGNYSDQLR